MRTARRRLFFSLPFLRPCKHYPRLVIIIIRSSRLANRCWSNDYNRHSKNATCAGTKIGKNRPDTPIARVYGFSFLREGAPVDWLLSHYVRKREVCLLYTNSRRHGFFLSSKHHAHAAYALPVFDRRIPASGRVETSLTRGRYFLHWTS